MTSDDPCDAPLSNKTVFAALTDTWLPIPKPAKRYAQARLLKGYEEYEEHLRMGWDKASAYALEEEGDLINYHMSGGNYVRVFLYAWIAFLGWLWDDRNVNNGYE